MAREVIKISVSSTVFGFEKEIRHAICDAIKNRLVKDVKDIVIDNVIDAVNVIVNDYIDIEQGVTLKEIKKIINKSPRTVNRYLRILKAIDFIESFDDVKTSIYYLTPHALEIINKKYEQ
jgi:hypothetical protein